MNFLRNFELNFRNFGIPRERWRYEVRKYFSGEAITFWFHLYDKNVDHSDWNGVKRNLLERFCRAAKETTLVQIAKL